MRTLRQDDLENLEKLARVQLVTSLPGVKPIGLIGTIDADGRTNLAPFSSIVHLGSNPPLLGMVTRPDVVDRHTLANLIQTGVFTINHLHPKIVEAAHQCSARYPRDKSEFDATGLTPHFEQSIKAPFVGESRFRIGLELVEIIDIKANNTKLVIGKVVLVQLPDHALDGKGNVDFSALEMVASTALDTYFTVKRHSQQPYAKAPK